MTTATSIRLVKEEDFDRITEVVAEAFVHDPVYNYFASLKEVSRRSMIPFPLSVESF